MGTPWAAIGISGVVLTLFALFQQREKSVGLIAFAAVTLIILALTQGPRFFIDIPPVRTLFYSVIPLSCMGAYLISRLRPYPYLLWPLISILALGSVTSVASAYQLSHTVRTNSTLLPTEQYLAETLRQDPTPGGVLIDDYNRRSASWLILSGRPMFTRIAADLRTQMTEARQSSERNQLYLNQLDFEKIFSLGSNPISAALLDKQGVTFITGITGSSAGAFAYNPALIPYAQAGDITVFKHTHYELPVTGYQSPVTNWLLRASTLANDIGDTEDTFSHLPASLRASRVSEPILDHGATARTTTATSIPLAFNVGDYVEALWSQEGQKRPDIDVELLVSFAAPPTTSLTVATVAGTTYPLRSDGSPVRIPAREVPFDDHGLIILTIQNPEHSRVSLDLIALGLAQVP